MDFLISTKQFTSPALFSETTKYFWLKLGKPVYVLLEMIVTCADIETALR